MSDILNINSSSTKDVMSELPTNYDSSLKLINADKVWDKTRGKGIKVLVVDSGIDTSHPEISSSIVSGMNFVDRSSDLIDNYNHGLHVAGLIAGKNIGVAPEVELYIAKSLNENGVGTLRSVVDGIIYGCNLNVDIISLSLGSKFELPVSVRTEIYRANSKGIVVVSAVGNDGKQYINYPARQDNVIAVGGLDSDLKYATFSNRGKELDITAPSVDVLSLYKENQYAYMTGTSMSSALTVGGIALLKSYYKDKGESLNAFDVLDKIKMLGNHSQMYGYGVLDLEKLLQD